MASNDSSTASTGAAVPSSDCTCCTAPSSAARTAGSSRAHTSAGHNRRTWAGRGCGSAPSNTSATRAKVWASRANQPQVSRLGARSSAPARLTRPCVGRSPNRPQWLAGARTEPPVSVPSAKSHRPDDTAEADPEDDPPVMRSGAAPLTGAPKWALLPFMEKASSSVTVFPARRAPASSSFCTVGAVRSLVPDRARTRGLPPPVGKPATSNRSLTPKLSPAKGPVPAWGTGTSGYGTNAWAGSCRGMVVGRKASKEEAVKGWAPIPAPWPLPHRCAGSAHGVPERSRSRAVVAPGMRR